MKIKPLKSYKPPAYPTFHESRKDARLLERLPRRWGGRNRIATLLGTGLLLGAARAENTAPAQGGETIAALPPGREKDAPQNAVRAIPATRVAPILDEALANDGRGAFGCVAISSPVFLSENEAVELILAELEKAGLKMRDMVAVDGLQTPDLKSEMERRKKEGGAGRQRVNVLKEGAHVFDFGTEDKSVAVKFLCHRDYKKWTNGPFFGLGGFYDFSWLATEMGNAFRQRAEGDPVIIGLFFDPLVDSKNDSEQENGAVALGKEKLRAQVSHFVEYLKQEGVVE